MESLRTDQLIIPNTSIPVSMVVSAAAAAVSAVYIVIVRSRMAKGKPLPFRAAFGSEDNETAPDAGQDNAEKPSD